jgi:hypothetical protein
MGIPNKCPICGGYLNIDILLTEERYGQDWIKISWEKWDFFCQGPCYEKGVWDTLLKIAEQIHE